MGTVEKKSLNRTPLPAAFIYLLHQDIGAPEEMFKNTNVYLKLFQKKKNTNGILILYFLPYLVSLYIALLPIQYTFIICRLHFFFQIHDHINLLRRL